jgi:hypothetical protein
LHGVICGRISATCTSAGVGAQLRADHLGEVLIGVI